LLSIADEVVPAPRGVRRRLVEDEFRQLEEDIHDVVNGLTSANASARLAHEDVTDLVRNTRERLEWSLFGGRRE